MRIPRRQQHRRALIFVCTDFRLPQQSPRQPEIYAKPTTDIPNPQNPVGHTIWQSIVAAPLFKFQAALEHAKGSLKRILCTIRTRRTLPPYLIFYFNQALSAISDIPPSSESHQSPRQYWQRVRGSALAPTRIAPRHAPRFAKTRLIAQQEAVPPRRQHRGSPSR